MANRKGPVTFEVPESIDVDAVRENVVRQQFLDEEPGPNLAEHLLSRTFLGRRRVGDSCYPRCATYEAHQERVEVVKALALYRAIAAAEEQSTAPKHPDNILLSRPRRAR